MTLYQQCMEAVDDLVANPPKGIGGVFTEMDVLAKVQKPSWNKARLKEAHRQANQVCGHQYLRTRKLCRYGPVILPNGQSDYGRLAGKIVYGSVENGPGEWITPNGSFPRLLASQDGIANAGRKAQDGRSDWTSWEEQDIMIPAVLRPTRGERPLHERLQEAERRNRELEAENTRLRARRADQLVDTVQQLRNEVDDLRQRDPKAA